MNLLNTAILLLGDILKKWILEHIPQATQEFLDEWVPKGLELFTYLSDPINFEKEKQAFLADAEGAWKRLTEGGQA
jgi:hypothetical protein